MELTIIMKKENLKQKHLDYAKEWHDPDEEGVYWVSESTDDWRTEECSFDRETGKLTVSIINNDKLFVSLVVPLIDLAMAANKANLSAIIDENIEKLMDAKKAFEKRKLDQ